MRVSTILLAVAVTTPAFAQTQAVRQAAASITEADVRRRINIVANDSMGGRNTPSHGLDLVAQYVAAEFQRLGLKPGGDSGSFLQRYPIRQLRLDPVASTLTMRGQEGGLISTTLSEGAALLFGGRPGTAPVVLLGGPLDSLASRGAALEGKAVVWLDDWNRPSGPALNALGPILGQKPAMVVVVANNDSLFARYRQMQTTLQTQVGDAGSTRTPLLLVSERTIAEQLPQAIDQILPVRSATSLVVMEVPGWEATLELKLDLVKETTAPNTVGILIGSDPALRQEYLVYSAHMDHIGTAGAEGAGCRAQGADSVCNGADDDASGTVGILELAEAFTRKGARPKRSIIFLTVSGEEHGLWGSDYFAQHPPVPLSRIVADLNADMIGRNWPDSIVVIGKEHSDLGATLGRVSAAHPELHMAALDDRWPEESFYTRSDHFNFARQGVPVLFFFNGVHPDYHQASDSPDKLDAEKEARIVRLMYYLGQDIGNAAARPKWNPESYAKFVTAKP